MSKILFIIEEDRSNVSAPSYYLAAIDVDEMNYLARTKLKDRPTDVHIDMSAGEIAILRRAKTGKSMTVDTYKINYDGRQELTLTLIGQKDFVCNPRSLVKLADQTLVAFRKDVSAYIHQWSQPFGRSKVVQLPPGLAYQFLVVASDPNVAVASRESSLTIVDLRPELFGETQNYEIHFSPETNSTRARASYSLTSMD